MFPEVFHVFSVFLWKVEPLNGKRMEHWVRMFLEELGSWMSQESSLAPSSGEAVNVEGPIFH